MVGTLSLLAVIGFYWYWPRPGMNPALVPVAADDHATFGEEIASGDLWINTSPASSVC